MNKKTIVFFVVASALISVVIAFLFKWIQTGDPFKAETVLYGAVVWLNSLITGSIALKFFQKYSDNATIELKKKIIPLFTGFVLLVLFISLSLVSAGVYTYYLVKGLDTTHFLQDLFQRELPGALRQITIWIVIGSILFFYVIWRKAIEREQKLREENIKYKYKNLKSQVNPHFLFNSLNTLSEIVYEDSKKADTYIQKLSAIYRYILENEETDLVPLNKEFEFVEQYFSLQKERDDDKILLNINVENADRFLVVPVSLQILVENALKHNSRSKENPLTVSIYNLEGYVAVSNVIQKKNTLESSHQTGLSNLKERVKLIVGKELIVTQENNLFLVKLPIRNYK